MLDRRAVTALGLAAPLIAATGARAKAVAPAPPATVVEDAPSSATTAPVRFNRYKHITTDVTVNGQGPFSFIVDTGANRSAVSEAVAERLGLPLGPPIRVHTVIGARLRPTVTVEELRVGDRAQRRLQAPTLVFSGATADGVLGVDWLKNRVLSFRFADSQLRIERSTPKTNFVTELNSNLVVVPAKLQSGQLAIINAQVGQDMISVMIDTGAQFTLGNPALRASVQRQFGDGLPSRPINIVTITGERMEGDLVFLPTLRIGVMQYRNVPIVFADLRVFSLWKLDDQPAVVLGLGALSALQSVSLDYGRGEVRFGLYSRRERARMRAAASRTTT